MSDFWWLLPVGLMVVALVGAALWGRWVIRHPSEYELEVQKQREAIDQVKAALGAEFVPMIQRLVDTVDSILKQVDRK